MKLPICQEDAKKGKLCTECEERLEQGEINEIDVKLSRILYKLNKKNTISDSVDLVRTKRLQGNTVLALVEGDPSTLIGKGGRIIRMISDQLGEKVRIIKNGTPIQITNDLITPVRACGVNVLYKEKGGKEKRITVPKESANRIKMNKEKIEKALNKVTNDEYRIMFI